MAKDLIQKSIIKTYRKEIWSKFVKAVKDFELIKANDKIAICISGGKDSFVLAKCMQELQRHGQFKFEVVYLVMDPGYNQNNLDKINENLEKLKIEAHIFKSDIFKVTDKIAHENPCYLCARMRRGYLYSEAKKLGCNKIALGHHLDDVIETTMMNLIFNGQYSSMMPKLKSDNFENMELIRPLYYIKEDDIKKWSNYNNLSFIDCACFVTSKKAGKREEIKNLIKDLKTRYQDADLSIFKSNMNVNLNTVVTYKKDNEEHSFLDMY